MFLCFVQAVRAADGVWAADSGRALQLPQPGETAANPGAIPTGKDTGEVLYSQQNHGLFIIVRGFWAIRQHCKWHLKRNRMAAS